MLTVDLERLGVSPNDRLLDAGCGGGRHCFGAMERGAHVIGLDLDPASLALARAGIRDRQHAASERRARELPPAPRPGSGGVLRSDVFHLPCPDASFDRVICSEVMEHVHDYRAAIRELVRVLRPGGTIGITIPTAITEHLYLRLCREYFESPGGHIRIFRPQALARAMADAGLRVDGVGFAHSLHSPYWALRALLGLDDESPRATRTYRKFLIRASNSRGWNRVEHALDRIWPKSLILYGTRVATGHE